MQNQPNQPNQPNNQSSNPLKNPTIGDFLHDRPLLTNLLSIFFGLTTPASILLNLKLSLLSTAIDSNSICPSFKEDVKTLLSLSDTSSITDSHIDTSSPPNIPNHTLMTCSYKISDSEVNQIERGKTYLYPIANYLSPPSTFKMAEVPITRDYLEEYCRKNNPKKTSFSSGRLVLEPVESGVQNYPVFRWKCIFDEANHVKPPNVPGTQTNTSYYSIDFDKFNVCANYTPQNKSYVLRYRYYYDPNSLYCVDPNFGNIPGATH